MLSCFVRARRLVAFGLVTNKKATAPLRSPIQFPRASHSNNVRSATRQSAPNPRAAHHPFAGHSLTTRRCPSARSLVTSQPLRRDQNVLIMASDDDYMNFLNKANEDPSAGSAQTTSKDTSKKEFKAADKGAEIPQPLITATKEAFYVSDADEPFVPVSLAWEKGSGLPNEGESPPSLTSFYNLTPLIYGLGEKSNAL